MTFARVSTDGQTLGARETAPREAGVVRVFSEEETGIKDFVRVLTGVFFKYECREAEKGGEASRRLSVLQRNLA
jgi:hypothetical protein